MNNIMELLKDYIEDCPEDFENLEVIYYASWQGYEESDKIIVFKFFDEIMMLNDGYCVMAESNEFIFCGGNDVFNRLYRRGDFFKW